MSSTASTPSSSSDDMVDDIAPIIMRSGELWIQDGNILLRTISTPAGSPAPHHILYKVHKGVLALHSSVFRDLFDGPQAAFHIGSETFEGLPIMDMPDSPDDVAHFLSALYFPETTQLHRLVPRRYTTIPPEYPGILRLATKYDVQNLRDTVITAFQIVWPTRLADWHELQNSITTNEDYPKDLAEGQVLDVSQLYEDPAKSIRLAIDLNVPELLPIAYYDLLRVHVRNGKCGPGVVRKTDTSILSTGEMKALVEGMATLQDLTNIHLIPLPDDMHEPGKALSGCQKRPKSVCGDRIRSHWLKQLKHVNEYGDVLLWLHTVANDYDTIGPDPICSSCMHKLTDRRARAREHFWSRLPKYFRLTDRVGDNWATA